MQHINESSVCFFIRNEAYKHVFSKTNSSPLNIVLMKRNVRNVQVETFDTTFHIEFFRIETTK